MFRSPLWHWNQPVYIGRLTKKRWKTYLILFLACSFGCCCSVSLSLSVSLSPLFFVVAVIDFVFGFASLLLFALFACPLDRLLYRFIINKLAFEWKKRIWFNFSSRFFVFFSIILFCNSFHCYGHNFFYSPFPLSNECHLLWCFASQRLSKK